MNAFKRKGDEGSVILLTTVVLIVFFAIFSAIIYRDATYNQESARLAAMQTDAAARESDIASRVLTDIPSAIYSSLRSNQSGNIDISAIVQSAIAQEGDTSTRYSLVGLSATNKVASDWITGASLSGSGVFVGTTSILNGSYATWGSGPTGDAGSADMWNYPSGSLGLLASAAGETLIARRYQWTTTVNISDSRDVIAKAKGQNITRTFAQTRRYSVYEVPFQLSVMADRGVNIGTESDGSASGSSLTVQSSVYARNATLSGSANIGGNVAVPGSANVSGGTVRGQSSSVPNPWGTDIYAPGGVMYNRQVSISSQSKNMIFVTLVPDKRYYSAEASPTNWEFYTRPYYRCEIRIEILSVNSFRVSIYNVNTQALLYNQTFTLGQNWDTQSFMTTTTTNVVSDNRTMFVLDPRELYAWESSLGLPGVTGNTVYIGYDVNATPTPEVSGDIAVTLTNTRKMSDLFGSGFALVTKQRFYYTDSFNELNPIGGCVVIAPEIRYNVGTDAQVDYAGQLGVVSGETTETKPTDFKTEQGVSVQKSNKSVTLRYVGGLGRVHRLRREIGLSRWKPYRIKMQIIKPSETVSQGHSEKPIPEPAAIVASSIREGRGVNDVAGHILNLPVAERDALTNKGAELLERILYMREEMGASDIQFRSGMHIYLHTKNDIPALIDFPVMDATTMAGLWLALKRSDPSFCVGEEDDYLRSFSARYYDDFAAEGGNPLNPIQVNLRMRVQVFLFDRGLGITCRILSDDIPALDTLEFLRAMWSCCKNLFHCGRVLLLFPGQWDRARARRWRVS